MRTASLSLDLDNQWSYMKTHGDGGWQDYPSYLDAVAPRVLAMLDELGLKITFFIVGQDAALERNRDALRSLPAAGHEIGCHSFKHEPWLHRYTDEQVEDELARAEESIQAATGEQPRGFRGPGFSFSNKVLQTLQERGYQYDASTFPTYIGPLARAYYFLFSDLDDDEKEDRGDLFGSWRDGLRSVKPYRWKLERGSLLEIPVTTMPFFKVPFHISYVLYLSTYSELVARTYFRNSLRLCRLAGVEPSILLHPLDFLGGDEVDECLSFFPAMKMRGEVKRDRVAGYLSDLSARFRVVPMGEHAAALEGSGRLPERTLREARATP